MAQAGGFSQQSGEKSRRRARRNTYLDCGFQTLFFLNNQLNPIVMIVYQIKLPKTKSTEEFVRFMNDEYIPAVHKGATRVGGVKNLSLLQDRGKTDHDFLWLVGWSGLPDHEATVDEKARQKLEGFKVKMKRMGEYNEVASWPE